MINARVMYCRPGNLFKDFVIEGNEQTVTSTGRVAVGFKGKGDRMLRGCLADADKEVREKYSTADHVVTHTIVQSGPPKAKRTERLICGNRTFYIIHVEDASGLGISTLYYAEERKDVT